MPLTGTDQVLKKAAESAAYGVLRNHMTPKLPEGAELPDDNLKALADAISEAAVVVLRHIIANNEVSPGIPVAVTGTPSAQAGATTAPGKVL